MSCETYRIRIWKGRNPDGKDHAGTPDEIIEVGANEPYLWKDDPHYHSLPLSIDIHPEDRSALLNIYTSDSVHPSEPRYNESGYVDNSYWDGPIERGLMYKDSHDTPPFGCEVWGRVLFCVEDVSNND